MSVAEGWEPLALAPYRGRRDPEVEEEDSELRTVAPGHCPVCSLDYELARMLTGRREESDKCSMCEQEAER